MHRATSIASVQDILDLDVYNVYAFMAREQWCGTLTDAFAKLYSITPHK